ncbi:serine hydrolase [Nocardia sp. NPDC052001]|uniref:serine hydrolase n=1 Tax=Nocardia sp. NPDC052001 TaxID=3154853 RepID=UPI003414AA1F
MWDVQSSAGLSAQLIQKNLATEWREGDTLRTIIENPDRATPPDTRTAYSNSNFFLLGLVLEKVTGKPVREVLNDLPWSFPWSPKTANGGSTWAGPACTCVPPGTPHRPAADLSYAR